MRIAIVMRRRSCRIERKMLHTLLIATMNPVVAAIWFNSELTVTGVVEIGKEYRYDSSFVTFVFNAGLKTLQSKFSTIH